MIRIQARHNEGVFSPIAPYPEGTARVIFDGAAYCCYDEKEAAEIAERERVEAEAAAAEQEAAERAADDAKTAQAEAEKQAAINEAVAIAVAAALGKS